MKKISDYLAKQMAYLLWSHKDKQTVAIIEKGRQLTKVTKKILDKAIVCLTHFENISTPSHPSTHPPTHTKLTDY